MRLLIILLLLTPSVSLAQQGTIEYSVDFDMEPPSIEMIMENLPPGIPVDSAMIEQGMRMFSQFQNQIQAIPMLMQYKRNISLLTFDPPALGYNTPFLSPPLTFTDYTERKVLSQAPVSFDENAYVIVDEFEPLDWIIVEGDSTLLNYPVKQAMFSSDTLNVTVWYTPEIASAAGPMNFGALPGLPLQITSTISVENGLNVRMNFTPVRLEEGLAEPLIPPDGELITREEYSKMMLQNMNPFQQ